MSLWLRTISLLFLFLLITPAFTIAALDLPRVSATELGAQVNRNLFREYHSDKDTWASTSVSMLKRQTHRANESFLKSAANFEHSSSQKKYPSIKELQNLLQKVRNHPVAGVKIAPRYDPNGAFGLCYGRALVTHTLLLQQGFHIVAKVFALGPLRFNGRLWDFHVALLVPRAKGQWWVMDSNETSVLPLERWMQKIKGLDRDPRAPSVRFYLTDASKFLPHKGEYSTMDFGQLQPKRFFEDLLAGSPMQ